MSSETLPRIEARRSRQRSLRLLTVLALNVSAAFASLRGNWFRSLLTVLGVVIGVAAVIVLVAFGEGAKREITSQIDTLGANVAVVTPGKLRGQANFNPTGGLGISNLTMKDVEAVRSAPGVRDAVPITFLSWPVFRGTQPAQMCLPIATTPSIERVRRLKIAQGRFFTADEMDQPVCVLGTGIRKDLFKEEAALGQTVAINGMPFRVLGVVSERTIGSGLFGGEELDAIVYLPQTYVQRITGFTQLHRIFIEVRPDQKPDAVLDRARKALLAAHGNRDDFSVVGARELLDIFYKVFTMLAALLLGITSISLVVGGIGIMNVMLVTVTERTREIGIRKTVGARRRDIFYQFLTEAVSLSTLGGMIGIGLAIVTCLVLGRWLPLRPVITSQSVLLGFSVCVAVGVISGVIPAVAAARKDPIEAIRHE